MLLLRFMKPMAGIALLAGVVFGGFVTRDRWLPWLSSPAPSAEQEGGQAGPAPVSAVQQARLTPQAQKNLGLVAQPLAVGTYWRTLDLPGQIIDPPGLCERAVAAPIPGVIARFHARPGDLVRAGDPLVTLRLVSDPLRNLQGDLFKATQEMAVNREQRARLQPAATKGAVPEARLIDLDNQYRLLGITAQACRQDLLGRGLTAAQVDEIARGTYVTEIIVYASNQPHEHGQASPAAGHPDVAQEPLEVQELKGRLGDQVQAGQALCLLADYQELLIEGRAFRHDAPLLERAMKEGWPVEVEFMEDASTGWPTPARELPINHVANTVDPVTRTFAFYLPLVNPSRPLRRDGKELLLWRFRPGQKVRLHVKAEKFEDVLVLPSDAVVRDGAEAYAFRQNGELFERRPVQVVYEDRRSVALGNDGSFRPGIDYVVRGAAASLNRIVKAQNTSGALPPGAHFHADGSLHIPGK